MIYSYCVRTDTGRVRDNNEDSVAYDEATNTVILADGMGGYNAGEVASGMATAYIKSEFHRWFMEAGPAINSKEVRRAMETCVNNANLAIYSAAKANSNYAGMGTTLVVGVFHEDMLLLGHIGDSRCYRLRGGILKQITRDHSLLQQQIDTGLITPEQAQHSHIRNLVTRALGVEEVVLLEVNEFPVEVGDIYLMCSDGLSDMLADTSIARIILKHPDLPSRAKALVDAANEAGGRDNISVLLVEVAMRLKSRV